MAREEPSNPNSDSEVEEGESSEEEESMEAIPDYEKQRLSRIAENKARMEALGLHKMASSFMPSPLKPSNPRVSTQRKGKRKLLYEDDDYKPSDNDDDDDEDTKDEEAEDDGDLTGKSSSKSRRKQSQKKVTKQKNKLPLEKHSRSKDSINTEVDEELMQAIALSLQDTAKKEKANFQDGVGRRKKPFSSRVQMTDDELILHFFQFDESGKGFVSVRDVQRVSVAHDFIWTDKELADMIHCFDSDGDGKLNLDDFRKIAGLCNVI